MRFGTDHPFFPPLGETEKWRSVVENLEAIEEVEGWTEEDKAGVRGGSALTSFSLSLAGRA
jgi:aminocarboxymuconate-semialdehyde decarboxylase